MRNKLAKCNKCGSYETNAKCWGEGLDVLQCFNCGTIQSGKLVERKLIQDKCCICKNDITRIDKKFTIPIWHRIRKDLSETECVCDFCYEMWKVEIFKHDTELREIDRKIQTEINEKREKEHLQELNSMSKEELINMIIELENYNPNDDD